MTESLTAADRLRHAVAYAITGTETSLLPSASTVPGTAPSFDVGELIADLGGATELRRIAAESRSAGRAWPYPIPDRKSVV